MRGCLLRIIILGALCLGVIYLVKNSTYLDEAYRKMKFYGEVIGKSVR